MTHHRFGPSRSSSLFDEESGSSSPRGRRLRVMLLLTLFAFVSTASALAEESSIKVGAIDAVLTVPPGVERPPVALLIAGSGSTDHDGNGPHISPATLTKR